MGNDPAQPKHHAIISIVATFVTVATIFAPLVFLAALTLIHDLAMSRLIAVLVSAALGAAAARSKFIRGIVAVFFRGIS